MSKGCWFYVARKGHHRYEAGTVIDRLEGDSGDVPNLGREGMKMYALVFVDGGVASDLVPKVHKIDFEALKESHPEESAKLDEALDRELAENFNRVRAPRVTAEACAKAKASAAIPASETASWFVDLEMR